MTTPDTTDTVPQPITGQTGGRPEGNSGYYLAAGSIRVRGHRFKWGDELPSPEGADLAERGFAVKGVENLRNRDGSRKPPPILRGDAGKSTAPGGVNDADDDAHGADGVDVSDRDGVHTEGSTGAEGRTSVTDSQAGTRVTSNEAQKPAARARK